MGKHVREITKKVRTKSRYNVMISFLCTVILGCAILAFAGIFGGAFSINASADISTRAQDAVRADYSADALDNATTELAVTWDTNGAMGTESTGYYWIYDGLAKGFGAVVSPNQGYELGGVDTTLSVKYQKEGTSAWSASTPITVGKYTVKVSLATENSEFFVDAESSFEIRKRAVSVNWVATGAQNTETNGLHWIYDGEVHKLAGELSGAAEADGTEKKLSVNVKFAAKGAGATLSDVVAALQPKSAGDYTAFAELTGTSAENYYIMDESGAEISYASQIYKITRRLVTVSWAKNPDSGDYSWVYSGYADRTTFTPDLEKQAESATGDTGVVTGQTLAVTVTYANVTGGVAGAYDTNVRVNAGSYSARVTHNDGNYVLTGDVLSFEITKRQVKLDWSGEGSYGADGDVLLWRYDSMPHAPEASATLPSSGVGAVNGGAVLAPYLETNGAQSEVTALSSFASTGYYQVTAQLKADAPDSFKNNYELTNTVKKFRIDKAYVTGIKWYKPDAESENGIKEITSRTSYVWGEVKGAGPGFTAKVTAKIMTAAGEKEITFIPNVSYPDANYQADENWPANSIAGYVVLATLAGQSTDGSENAARFELKIFDGGNASACDTTRFYITSMAGDIAEVTVTWVVFTDGTNYIELNALKETPGGVALNAGGHASVTDGKFTFEYTGKEQSPVAIWKYDEPDEEGATYELLPLGSDCKKVAAGTWTAYLQPMPEYNYKNGTTECQYVITPLTVKIDWGTMTFEYNDKERKPDPKIDAEYLNAQPDWYKAIITEMRKSDGELAAFDVAGATDAGEYDVQINLGANFVFADGTDKAKLVIKQHEVLVSDVVWTFDENAKNDTTGTGGKPDKDAWYWNYDGQEHCPVPTLTVTLDGVTVKTLTLTTIGAATEMGEYYAYAWLDVSDLQNRNFILVESQGQTVSAQAVQKFTIAHVAISAIYWAGAQAEEGYTGATIEIGGVAYVLSVNGATELEHIFDGATWSPKAYYKVGENYEAFEVEGAMRDAGRYYATIKGEYNIKGPDGTPVSQNCAFKILPKEVTVKWQSPAEGETLKFTYTGLKQHPSVEFTGGIAGEEITYEITGYADAGNYNAEIKFTNPNYTYAGKSGEANFCKFTITPKIITVGWGYENNAGMHGDGADTFPYWQYAAAAPELFVSSVDGNTDCTLAMSGFGDVKFTFDYVGLSGSVGKHTAKAVIKTATLDGKSVLATNFEIAEEGNSKAYEITVYEITVRWTGNPDNEGKFEWTYDGKPHAPTAEYLLWDNEWHTATVSGERIVFGTYSALAALPAEHIGNCVFAEVQVELEGGTFETRSAAECDFKINKAKVTVRWTFDEAIYNNEKGVWELEYDGKEHAPRAFDNKTGIELTVKGWVADAGNNHMASAELPDAANYEFENESDSFCFFTIKVKTVWIKWIDDSGDDTPEFSWIYTPHVERAPKAIMANEDGSDFLIDGQVVYAIVSGGATHFGEYTATAEIVSSNYAFPEGKTFTHKFWILKRELTEVHFWWTDEDKIVDGWYVYEFNGQSQHPLAESRNFTEFSYEFTAVDQNKLPTGGNLDGITDAGEYKVTIEILNNLDYCIPEGLEHVFVRITPKNIVVIWDETPLVYNGENQAPEAYYKDLNGTTYPLNVTVTETVHKYASETYHATAEFISAENIKNYKLDDETKVKEYEIQRRALTLTWGEHEFTYDGNGHYVLPDVDISNAIITDFIDITTGNTVMGITYVIKDKDGNVIRDGLNNPVKAVVDAGEYKMSIILTGPDTVIKNYDFKDDDGDGEQIFIINKAVLVVTADDKTVNYGDAAPLLTATFGETVTEGGVEKVIHTLIGVTEAEIEGLIVNGKRPWLDCAYAPGDVPDTLGYDINVDIAMLQKLLPNYEIRAYIGKLYVYADENTIIWYGDRFVGDPNFEYDGKEHKPEAYLYKNPDMLEVVYVDKDGNELEDFKAINAGTYYVKAIAPFGVTINGQSMISYEIKPREIIINIRYIEIAYGDREIAEDGGNLLTEVEQNTIWSYATDKREVEGDELNLTFTWNVSSGIKGGYLNAGKYFIEGHSDAGANYKIIFQGVNNNDEENKQYGLYVVTNAEIFDESKNGNEWFTDEPVLEQGEKYLIGIATTGKGDRRYKYIVFAGDQTAQVKFSYSAPYLVGAAEEIPETGEDENYPYTNVNDVAITENGTYVINYRVEIANHDAYYGKWTIIVRHSAETVIIIFVKPFEIEYGSEVPEDLAATLIDGGYVEISGAITDKEYLKQVVQAVVPTGYHSFANNRTAVGKYDILFKLYPELVNTDELSIAYSKNKQDGESNENAYSVTPRRLTVEWGEIEFDYDGKLHLPAPVIGNFITASDKTLEGISNGREYGVTDAGVLLIITAHTAGNFKDSGAHKIVLTIDNENYQITLMDAVQAISIKGGQTTTGLFGIPWWLVILIVVLAAATVVTVIIFVSESRKRKPTVAIGDDDGFYEDYVDEQFTAAEATSPADTAAAENQPAEQPAQEPAESKPAEKPAEEANEGETAQEVNADGAEEQN